MTKRPSPPVTVEIASDYEQHVTGLSAIDGDVSDYPITPAQAVTPAQRPTWLPAQTPQQAHQASRQATVGQLRQMIDQQSQEPQSTATGNRFIINETTDASDRAGAGLRWWIMLSWSLTPLVFGVALWIFWGWGFLAFLFTCLGVGLLLGEILLNWQATSQSPIAIEKRQRGYDHDYRMFKEENAQRTRELIIGGFIGQAHGDMQRNAPIVDGQALLTDSQNRVQR